MHALRPTDRQTVETLRFVAAKLETDVAYVFEGRFHFRLDSRWSVAVSPESAGRFRVSVFRDGRERATLWVLAGDRDRLADLVLSAKAEVAALAA
jgi:hypothetical protein